MEGFLFSVAQDSHQVQEDGRVCAAVGGKDRRARKYGHLATATDRSCHKEVLCNVTCNKNST